MPTYICTDVHVSINCMLDKDAFDIEKLRIKCNLKNFKIQTCVKDPSVVITQKNESINC